MRECCRQVEAEEVSNSRNKIHQTTYKPFSESLYVCKGLRNPINSEMHPLQGKHNRKRDLPESVEAVLGAVDGEDGGAGVGLGHAPVPLQDDDFGPDLVVDRVPLAENLVDVILQDKREGDNEAKRS